MSLVNFLLVGLLGAMLGIALYTSRMSLSDATQPEIAPVALGMA
jgi:hypothetical protein